jgi:hypothetical protein
MNFPEARRREWGVEGIEEYLETKVLAWRV